MASSDDLEVDSDESLKQKVIEKPNVIHTLPISAPVPAPVPHDIEGEITDLENLIKKLQVEISVMTEMANKPVESKLIISSEVKSDEGDDKETEESVNSTSNEINTKRIDSLNISPVNNVINTKSNLLEMAAESNEKKTTTSNKNENTFTRAFKNLFWNNSMANNTNNSTPPHGLNTNDMLQINDNAVNFRNTIQEYNENILNAPENESLELDSKVSNDSKKIDDKPENTSVYSENKEQKISDVNKPQSTVRLGILMHIFGGRQKTVTLNPDDCKVSKQLDQENISENNQASTLSKTVDEDIKKEITNLNKSETFDVETYPSKNNIAIFSDTNIQETKEIQLEPTLEKSEEISKISDHQSDKLNDILALPYLTDVSDSLCNKSSQTIDNHNNSYNLTNDNVYCEHDESPRMDLEECAINSDPHKDDLQTSPDIKMDIPRRTSIVNIYVDNIVTSKQQDESRVSQTNYYHTDKENTTIEAKMLNVKLSKPIDRDLKNPSSDTSVISDKIEISEVTEQDKKDIDLLDAKSSATEIKAVDSDTELINKNTKISTSPALLTTNKSNVNIYVKTGEPVNVYTRTESIRSQHTEIHHIDFPEGDKIDNPEQNILVNSIATSTVLSNHECSKDEENVFDCTSKVIVSENVNSENNAINTYQTLVAHSEMKDTTEAASGENCNKNLLVNTDNDFILVEGKSAENVSYENENDDLTDEYESIAEDISSIESSSVQNVANPDTTANGDNISDVYEDSQDS